MTLDRRTVLTGSALLAAANLLTGGMAAAAVQAARKDHAALVRDLVGRMTLAEKIGQLNQPPGGRQKALNSKIDAAALDLVRRGGVGSWLHVAGADFCEKLQRVAVKESRLGIPLLFAADVIHGFRTIFPVPLAMAASWDPQVHERAARIAATETFVSGLHWTFAPMVDVARDARWGRVVEGAGEDPYLGSRMAVAQIRGFQTDDLAGKDAILACAKHFGAYGAVAGGRDYDSAELSERTLNEVYLPAFHAAAEAGAGTFMTAFNDIAGVPTTGNATLVRGVLRDTWHYQGLVVSDWQAVRELIAHGVAADDTEAAALALKASVDMDMAASLYAAQLEAAVAREPALLAYLDEAVARILSVKARIGLFDDPFRFGDAKREARELLSPASRKAAHAAAVRSIVLLRNERELLPIKPDVRRIALIGALADDASSAIGSWRARGRAEDAVTLRAALAARKGLELSWHPGIPPRSDDVAPIADAVALAGAADLTLLVIGEDYDHSAEARSRADISLPGAQGRLAQAVLATGKPVVVILMNGRPLALDGAVAAAPALLETWFLGVESGPAIADVLFGAASPGGRLPMGFPRTTGQLPMHYAHVATGRPADPDLTKDTARYHDVDVGPLFPFGHGLSYSRFGYSQAVLDRAVIGPDEAVAISVTVTNEGKVEADEVVQLYVRDPVASVARPIKELRGFVRVRLAPGTSRRVTFRLAAAQLALWQAGRWKIEAGRIEVMLGASSEDIRARAAFSITADGWGSRPAAAIETPVEVARA